MKKKMILNGQEIKVGGGTSYSAGDGIAIENGEISVTLPSKEVTTAEYNALSEEEKMSDVAYIITDDNEEGGSSGGGMSVPSGVIWPWYHVDETPVPDGWALCDGQNGTPDLRGRFILGASANHAMGETGGSEEVTLYIPQIPDHFHSVNVGNSSGSVINTYHIAAPFNRTNYDGDYINTSHVGGGQPHNNMPPYFTIDYIMKL